MPTGSGAIVVHSQLEKDLVVYHDDQLCTVITSVISAVREIIVDGETGVLIPPK